MRRKFIILLIVILALIPASLTSAEENDSYIEKINDIPDFTQQNSQLPQNGNTYCGPVSVSNSIVWLSKNGYPSLASGKSQLEIIQQLGKLMQTNDDGTDSFEIMNGLKTYINNHGEHIDKLGYQGRNSDTHRIPDINLARNALKFHGGVWLNIGWYRYKKIKGVDIFERYGGHWVTLVGYGYDGSRVAPDYLVIHDPSNRAGKSFQNNYVKLIPLTSGQLISGKGKNYRGLPAKAVGFNKLGGEIKVNTKVGDTAIIDGVIILKMSK